MNTIKAFQITLSTLSAFVFTYLSGEVLMRLAFHFELTDWDIREDILLMIHFALGLPVLWVQLQVMKYAIRIKTEL